VMEIQLSRLSPVVFILIGNTVRVLLFCKFLALRATFWTTVSF